MAEDTGYNVAVDASGSETDNIPKITPAARHYRLHREEQLARKKEEYKNRPNVIAKKGERERMKAEKEAEKEAKRIEKERVRQEMIEVAKATKRRFKEKSGGGLDSLLAESSPAL